jgi:hypothetical protein
MFTEVNVSPTRTGWAVIDSVNLVFITNQRDIELQGDHSKDWFAARVGLKFEQNSKRKVSSHCSLI